MKSLKFLLAAAVVAGVSLPARAVDIGDPSAVNLKILAAWVSPNVGCTDAVQIFSDPSVAYKNMMANPTFGAGTIANGTYPCVIFKVSDAIKTTSAYNSTSGHCIAGTEYVQDIFRAPETSSCPDGTTATGVTNALGAEQTPCIYFRVGGTGGGAFDAAHAIAISNAWAVASDSDGTFVMDFTGKQVDSGVDCGVDPPVMTFR